MILNAKSSDALRKLTFQKSPDMRQFRVCDSVEAYGLEKALDKACIDLDRVDKMSDTEACAFCNTDTKEEALEVIQEEIDYIEFQLDRIAV